MFQKVAQLLRGRLAQNAIALYGVTIANAILPLVTVPYLARVLRPGGRLLIDFWNREHELRAFQETVLDRRDDDILEIEEWTFDHLAGRLNWTNTVVFPDGRREAWHHTIRAYTVVEIKKMLETAGFELTAVYGSLAGEPYTMDSQAAIFVARRP